MAHLALGLERKRRFIGAAGLEMLKIFHALRVHQIEVEIVHAAGGELAFKKGPDVRLRFEKVRRQLVGQNIVLTRIAAPGRPSAPFRSSRPDSRGRCQNS